MALFGSKMEKGLEKTRSSFLERLGQALTGARLDEALFEEIEEILILADVGIATAQEIMAQLRRQVKEKRINNPDALREALREIIAAMLTLPAPMLPEDKPTVLLVTGVNGVGKTTTIGKLAAYYTAQGKSVLLGAADTFRAAAADQLEAWAQRAGCPIIRQAEGSDPAAVVYDTLAAGKARGKNLIICDTAGRLHNKKNLMDELSKISRVIDREAAGSHRENWLVLDATTGQNGLNQAKEFAAAANLTGIVLTKLDGTAKGGIVIAITHQLGLPVRFVGVGEQLEDLRPFVPEEFAGALFAAQTTQEE